MTEQCNHLGDIRDVAPHTLQRCEDCLAAGTHWVHPRLFLECGRVGCCDPSPMKHATRHFHASKHPVMRSLEQVEAGGWCYISELSSEPAPRAPAS